MNNIWFRFIAGLVLVAAIFGIGYFAYNAGVAQGAVASPPAAGGAPGSQPYPYYGYGMPFWHPFPFFGFGCLGLLLPLFLLMIAFGAFRRMIWGPRWGWHGMHHRHWMDAEGNQGVPPMVSEWHKRMHGESEPTRKD